MIGIYIDFNSQHDFESIEAELHKIGGYEVGGHDNDSPCWKLAEYSVGRGIADLTEDECLEIKQKAETLLKANNIEYSISHNS